MFLHFWQKFENSKWPPFLGRGNFLFCKLARVYFLDTLRVENFGEIALSCMVKEMEANLCFLHFLQQFKNSKWPPFLGRKIFFLKIGRSILFGYPVGSKFQRNRSISHG